MNARDLVEAARREGVTLVPDGESLRLRGDPEVVQRWAPRLKPAKAAVMALLGDANKPTFAEVESHLRGIALAAGLPWTRMRTDRDGIRDVDVQDVRDHWHDYTADPRFLRVYVAAVGYRLALDPEFIR